jgi:hypothetical protein
MSVLPEKYLGRPRSSSFENDRTSSKKNSDYGSFTVTHTDVPHKQKKRAKSLENIKESLKGIDEKQFNLSKFILFKSRSSCSSESLSSTKSRSSSVCEEIIYEEEEEVDTQKASNS